MLIVFRLSIQSTSFIFCRRLILFTDLWRRRKYEDFEGIYDFEYRMAFV